MIITLMHLYFGAVYLIDYGILGLYLFIALILFDLCLDFIP